MAMATSDRAFLARLLLTAGVQGGLLAAVMWGLHRIMNENSSRHYRKRVAGKDLRLNKSEYELLDCVCEAADIDDDFGCVGGLGDVKAAVQRSVVLPFQHPELYPPNSLRSPPKGLLLYGPPGTGKTLIARAIARTCGATFIEVRVESLFGKWLGQSEQAVAAIFSLARKLEPSVIFVDEIDSLLSRRDFSDNHVYTNAKTIFLRQWDGFATRDREHRVVVMGATNCPEVLDAAVLRRLPVKLRLELPEESERLEILQIMLSGEDLSGVDLPRVSAMTRNYSGSDLRELCKQALLLATQDELAALAGPGRQQSGTASDAPRARTVRLSSQDFERALQCVSSNVDFARRLVGEDFRDAAEL